MSPSHAHLISPFLFLLLPLYMMTGCNVDTMTRTAGEEDLVEFSTPGSADLDAESPIAVGSQVLFEISAQHPLEDGHVDTVQNWSFDPPGIFEVVEQDGNSLRIEALDTGESTLHLETLHSDGQVRADRLRLVAADVSRAEFNPRCSTDSALIRDRKYRGRLRLFDAEDTPLRGEGLHPIQTEPQDSLTWSAGGEFMDLNFHTAELAQETTISPLSGTAHTFPMIHSEDADGIDLTWFPIGRDEENLVDENEDIFFLEETPFISIQRIFDDRPICERSGSYRVSTQTPDSCILLADEESPLEQTLEYRENNYLSGALFGLEFVDTGECIVQVEALHHVDDSDPLVAEFSWPIEP